MEELVTSNGVELSKESYSINWLGKSYARLLANENPLTMLKEDKIHNCLEENKNSQNILIKGDNLEVLKHLKNAYENQIKMIYIDPPYNTGGDGFVYNDDRKFTIEELSQLAGVSLEESKKILEFTESNSNSHSAWLTFMYPRLYIARELLSDEGVMFISIDDNEASQLKLLCDEIFGEENFIAEIPTIMNLKGNQDNFGFADTHEYFYVYCKNKEKAVLNKFDIEEDELEKEWDEDEYGLYKKADGLRRTGDDSARNKRPKGWFPVFITKEHNIYVTDDDKPKSIDDYVLYPINDEGEELSWSWSKKKITNESYNLIVTNGGKNLNIYKKQRPQIGDLPTKKPKSFFYKPDYSTSTATTQLKNLLGKKVFKSPKPVPFIKDLLIIGSDENDIILDFFAGSGTTAHAIMELNKNGQNRKFITVQLSELIEEKKNSIAYDFVKELKKIQYPYIQEKIILKKFPPTIYDITKERIIRVSKKIKEDIEQDVAKNINDYDLGFKIFETVPRLDNSLDKMDKFDEKNPKLFDVTTLKEDDFNTILTTWKVYDGIKLTDELTEVTFKSYKAYYGDKKLYFIHSGFTTEDLKEFIKKLDEDEKFQPNKLILFGYIFASRYQREISEALTSYTNKKSIEIDMIVRY
jgi:adenine-specific DNA-methyltransferase